MAKPKPDPETLQRLVEIFRRLGCTRPESWAKSQLEEGIPQLAYFVFFKQAWESIIDEKNADEWFGTATKMGALARAVDKVISHGVPRAELATLIQLIQHQALIEFCSLLDEGSFASPINVAEDEEWPRVQWALHLIDDNGTILDKLTCLHEFADGDPPDGRESGFR